MGLGGGCGSKQGPICRCLLNTRMPSKRLKKRLQGLRRVQGSGLRAQGLGFRVQGAGFRV